MYKIKNVDSHSQRQKRTLTAGNESRLHMNPLQIWQLSHSNLLILWLKIRVDSSHSYSCRHLCQQYKTDEMGDLWPASLNPGLLQYTPSNLFWIVSSHLVKSQNSQLCLCRWILVGAGRWATLSVCVRACVCVCIVTLLCPEVYDTSQMQIND